MNTPMANNSTYTDVQGTVFSANQSDMPEMGATARLNDGKFQFNLTGTDLWMQMTFAPLSSKLVAA